MMGPPIVTTSQAASRSAPMEICTVSGTASTVAPTNFDYVTIANSREGAGLWTNRYDGPNHGYDQATAMAVGTNGLIYADGNFRASLYYHRLVARWRECYGSNARRARVARTQFASGRRAISMSPAHSMVHNWKTTQPWPIRVKAFLCGRIVITAPATAWKK